MRHIIYYLKFKWDKFSNKLLFKNKSIIKVIIYCSKYNIPVFIKMLIEFHYIKYLFIVKIIIDITFYPFELEIYNNTIKKIIKYNKI